MDIRALYPAVETVHQNGWVLLRGFLSQGTVAQLKSELEDAVESPSRFRDCMYYLEEDSSGQKRLNRIERIWDALPMVRDGDLGRRLLGLAEDYFEEPCVLFKDKLNIRYAGSPGYGAHQDSAAGWDRFADRFLSVGIFLNESDRRRGGFSVVTGWHSRGRLKNTNGKLDSHYYAQMDPSPVETGPGDLIILDSEAPHGSFDNLSEEDSLHLLFTFAPLRFGNIREAYYKEKAESFAGSRRDNIFDFRVFSFE